MSSFFRRAGAQLARFFKSVDPAATPNEFTVYCKDDGIGDSQLWGRSDNGTIYQITPGTPGPIGPAGSSAVIGFADNSISAAADTRFIDEWNGGNTAVAPTTETTPIVSPRAGTLRNLFVRHAAAAGNGNLVVYTVRINGVDTLLTATLATGAIGQASNLFNIALVAQGDRITLRAVKPLAVGGGSIMVSATMEIA
jgi:hypothetical protein